MSGLRRRDVLAGLGCAAAAPRVAWARLPGVEDALRAVGDARYIAIGERHDNPVHHRVQADLVAALQPAGIAFEMIPREREWLVNDLRFQGASRAELAEALDWADSGWPDFAHYAPILEAAPGAYIAGGGLSRKTMAAIHEKGASGLGPDMTARYWLDEPFLPEVEAAMLDEQFDAHCGLLDRARLGSMVAVQRAWDAAYAEAWRRASLRSGGGRAVLICGNVHARLQTGAPGYLSHAIRHTVPEATVASIGQTEEGDDPVPAGFYTATIRLPRPDRADPCERMRTRMRQSE